MGSAEKGTKAPPEEYFTAENYEWLQKATAYDHEDPERFMFADDGEVVEACKNYADDIINEENDWFFGLCLGQEPDYVPKYAESPDFGRVLVLGLCWYVDVWRNVEATRWLGFLHQTGRFVEKDVQEAARLYRFCESKGDRQSMINLGYLYEYGLLEEPDYEASFKQFAKVMALHNYQIAEIGLRIEVVYDGPWYAERLEQAIEGQDRARALMHEMGWICPRGAGWIWPKATLI